MLMDERTGREIGGRLGVWKEGWMGSLVNG